MLLFDCKSLQKWVTMEGMQKEGLRSIVKKSRELAPSPSPAGLKNNTNRRCRTAPLSALPLEEQFTEGGSLSSQSHLQKLQRYVLKWVQAPSLQPSTCSTYRDNDCIQTPAMADFWQYGRQLKIFSALSKKSEHFSSLIDQPSKLLFWDGIENFLKLRVLNLN